MKIISTYTNFLNEKYQEDPEVRIKKFFTELEKNINYWFEEGSFGANESELIDIDIKTNNNIEKYLKADFIDKECYYQMIFIVTLEEVEEDVLKECHIKIKRYDLEQSTLIREIGKDINIKDINEDSVLNLFTELDEESKSMLDDEEDGVILDDDDTNLEDTDIF